MPGKKPVRIAPSILERDRSVLGPVNRGMRAGNFNPGGMLRLHLNRHTLFLII